MPALIRAFRSPDSDEQPPSQTSFGSHTHRAHPVQDEGQAVLQRGHALAVSFTATRGPGCPRRDSVPKEHHAMTASTIAICLVGALAFAVIFAMLGWIVDLLMRIERGVRERRD